MVSVGVEVGLGELLAVGFNAGAAWDWQAARSRISRTDTRIAFMGKDAFGK